MDHLTELHDILKMAGVSDHELVGGIELTEEGYDKLSKRFGIGVGEVKGLINKLVYSLRDEDGELFESDQSVRYSYEADFLKNVTVRDAVTGEEIYFGGSEAAQLMTQLDKLPEGSPEEQAVLQQCADHYQASQELTEDDSYDDVEGNDAFESEIRNESGSFNFPWKADGKHGTATAAYTGDKKDFRLRLVSVRDSEGDEVMADDATMKVLRKQALDFIGEE